MIVNLISLSRSILLNNFKIFENNTMSQATGTYLDMCRASDFVVDKEQKRLYDQLVSHYATHFTYRFRNDHERRIIARSRLWRDKLFFQIEKGKTFDQDGSGPHVCHIRGLNDNESNEKILIRVDMNGYIDTDWILVNGVEKRGVVAWAIFQSQVLEWPWAFLE